MAETQLSLIAAVSVTFVLALLALIVALSALRRRRHRRQVVPAWEAATQPVFILGDTMPNPALQLPVETSAAPIPLAHPPTSPAFQVPALSSTPEQMVLTIEPTQGPTRDQQNVQKLIDFLKRDKEPIQKVG